MPIKVTSAEILSRLNMRSPVGHRQVPMVTLDQTSDASMLAGAVPSGFVFLATHFVGQANDPPLLGANNASPDFAASGITIENSAGSAQWVINMLAFRRRQQLFEFQDSPNWRNARPGNAFCWRPKYAVPIPEGWLVNASATIGGAGNCAAVYGHLVPIATAQTYGYGNDPNSTTPATRTFDIVSATGGNGQLITGRANKCIRILDVCIRMQPIVAGTTNIITLAQDDGEVFYRVVNNNPSDLVERTFSPEWYLKKGQGVDLVATTGTHSTIITYEYVNPEDVPHSTFWCSVLPQLPTPTLAGAGLSELFRTVSTAITLYYPCINANGDTKTATAPGTNLQHYIRGFDISVQKDATVTTPDMLFFTVSAGDTGGALEFGLGTLGPQTNYQVLPVFSASDHDQNVGLAVDDLNIPCPRGADGALWVDSISFAAGAAATPVSTDTDTDEWYVNLWGRTQQAEMQDEANRGT